jgi:hypothetical protein
MVFTRSGQLLVHQSSHTFFVLLLCAVIHLWELGWSISLCLFFSRTSQDGLWSMVCGWVFLINPLWSATVAWHSFLVLLQPIRLASFGISNLPVMAHWVGYQFL